MYKKLILTLMISSTILFGTSIAVLETTQGKIELELRDDLAPLAVENFTKLIKKGYYDGIIFHRIIPQFMIQSGDPQGTGRGGNSVWGKSFQDEFNPSAQFDRPGVLAMANRGPNTNGSQFFITTVETRWLNGKHTIFGYVKDKQSFQVVRKLENIKTSRGNRPIVEQKIIKAYIK
jgi:peptidylprolyl isomerase